MRSELVLLNPFKRVSQRELDKSIRPNIKQSENHSLDGQKDGFLRYEKGWGLGAGLLQQWGKSRSHVAVQAELWPGGRS